MNPEDFSLEAAARGLTLPGTQRIAHDFTEVLPD